MDLEDRYCLHRVIGRGGYGTVYVGHARTNNHKVAVKVEILYNGFDEPDSYLERESNVYTKLNGKASIGIANMTLFGWDEGYQWPRCFLVMELLGMDLEQLLRQCSGKFSLKTVLMLADQMLSIIQYIHSKGYIHGDVKPGNFLFGRKNKHKMLYMVDFGLAKEYIDPLTKDHIPYNDKAHYQGTTRFTSINCHQGFELSRRDDMESLGYVFLYLLRGNLPWQHLKVSEASDKNEKKRILVYEKKLSTSIDELCNGQPCEFMTYIKYCRSLQYDEEPDYTYLQTLFKELFNRSGYTDNSEFDWEHSTVTEDLHKGDEEGQTSTTDSDNKHKGRLKCQKKFHKCGSKKFEEDSTVFAGQVEPWEMVEYLSVTYDTFQSLSDRGQATVEQHVEETFRFIAPEGVPDNFLNNNLKASSWKDVTSEMCDVFFNVKGDWLKENFMLDYTSASEKERNDQIDICLKTRAEKPQKIVQNSHASADLAIEIHAVLEMLQSQKFRGHHQQGGRSQGHRHDNIKHVIYSMMSYTDCTFLHDGSCSFEFQMHDVPGRRGDRDAVTIKGSPDAMLYISRHTASYQEYPYCVVEVDGQPYSENIPEKVCDIVTGSDSSRSSSTHTSMDEIIREALPFNNCSISTFTKISAELVLDMLGMIVRQQIHLHSETDTCQGIGLFVLNEKVYMAKMRHKKTVIHEIVTNTPVTAPFEPGPNVIYSDWCFDLRKPNDRLGLLIFLFHYKYFIQCINVKLNESV